jgi:hypothetical protein
LLYHEWSLAYVLKTLTSATTASGGRSSRLGSISLASFANISSTVLDGLARTLNSFHKFNF